MSDATAVFLMLGVLLMALVVGAYVTKIANDRMDEILIGVVQGASVSRKHRSVMLYNQWLPMMSGLAGASLIIGAGYLQIAALVSSGGVRFLAYVLAGMIGWSFAMYLFLGASTWLQCLSVLRGIERES